MPLPGGAWNIIANGAEDVLELTAQTGDGPLTGSPTVFEQPIFGFWDEGSQKITFVRVLTPKDPTTIQVYTGYLMSGANRLAGSFEALSGGGGTAQQSVFGWSATLQPPIQ